MVAPTSATHRAWIDDADCDLDGAWEACHAIFGVVSLCRCRPCEKDLDAIFAAIENYLGDDLDCAQSFKVESKRSDKSLRFSSVRPVLGLYTSN